LFFWGRRPGGALGLRPGEAEVFERLSEFFRAYVGIMNLVRIYLDASPVFHEHRGIIA